MSMKKDNIISICFSVSEWYVPYFMVCFQSLLEYINSDDRYIITILEKELSEKSKQELKNMIVVKNLKLNFLNMTLYIKNKKFKFHDHVSEETFFKLFAPIIFKKYKKILFCDADILFQDDPAKLFMLNMRDKKLGAALCNLWNGIMQGDKNAKNYTIDKLHIKNLDNYFQAGIILFNNTKITQNDVDNLINLAQEDEYLCMDQDVLNRYFQNDVFIFDSRWNYETSQEGFRRISIPFMSPKHKQIWLKAGKNPAIIHYSGQEKPWYFSKEEYAETWWSYAVKTVKYSVLQNRLEQYSMINKEIQQLRSEFDKFHFPNINRQFKLSFVMNHLLHFRLKKFGYALKKAFAFGERYAKYNDKYRKTKQLIKDAKKLKKSYYKV